MSSKNLVCPHCQATLTKPVCDECQTDIRELFMPKRKGTQEICEILAQAGGFIDRSTRNLVIPGSDVWGYFSMATARYSNTDRELLCEYVRDLSGMALKQWGKNDAQRFLFDIYRKEPAVLPKINHIGDKPQLFLHENGELIWPFTTDTLPGRMWEYGSEGLFYTGPILRPRPTGAFEQFLAECRCEHSEDRDVLRQWMRTAVCPSLLTPGQFPLLLLCARGHGAGKSTTADVIGMLLGGALSVYWKDQYTIDDLNRQLMDPQNRLLIIDNIRPAPGQLVFDSSMLAHFITQKELTVKQLYHSTGAVRVPARYQFIGTANHPQFSGELLSRCTVCTLTSVDESKTHRWMQTWTERRVELLEDLLFTTMENWKKGPLGPLAERYRFEDWQELAQRLDQQQPVVIPRTSMARSPLELMLIELWEQFRYPDRVQWEKIEAFLRNAQTGTAAVVKNQLANDWREITNDLYSYHSQFCGVLDESGQRWIYRR